MLPLSFSERSKTLVLAKTFSDYSLKLFAKTEVNLSFGLKPHFTSGLSFGLKLQFKNKVLAEKFNNALLHVNDSVDFATCHIVID